MTPLFDEQTKLQLERFMSGKQHAAILSAPQLAGMEELVNTTADKTLTGYVMLSIQPEAPSIGIEQIRSLKQSLSLKQLSDQHRLLLVRHAEKMTPEAQNSFLKLLEEPPAGIKILLLTTRYSALLPTIRSRAAMLTVRPISMSEALDHYGKQAIAEDVIKKSYAISDGQPTGLYALLSADSNTYSEAINSAKEILQQQPYERLLKVDALSKDKEELSQVLFALSDILRAANRAAAKQSSRSVNQLAEKRRVIQDAIKSLQGNVNLRLLITDVLLSI